MPDTNTIPPLDERPKANDKAIIPPARQTPFTRLVRARTGLTIALVIVNILLIAALVFFLAVKDRQARERLDALEANDAAILSEALDAKERSALTTLEKIYSYIEGLGKVEYADGERIYLSDSTYGEIWVGLLSSLPKLNASASDFSRSGDVIIYTGHEYETRQGIDVSSFQGENIDWQAVRASGVDHVIIRAGYRGYGAAGKLMPDERFIDNVNGAYEAGLDIGAYFFSQAVSVEEAVEEAWYFIDLAAEVKDKINLEVYFDWEPIFGEKSARTNGLKASVLNQAAAAFCGVIRDEGYMPGIYFNLRLGVLKYDLADFADCAFWYAQYYDAPDIPYEMRQWQYTGSGAVPGIEGEVDRDLRFVPRAG